MGGYGSGRQGWLPVVEDGLKLDLRRLRQRGDFSKNVVARNGTLTWSYTRTGEKIATVGYSYDSWCEAPWFRLQYTVTASDGDAHRIDETIRLERFSQPFGGYRWYFLCPSTKRRCQCLYKPAGAFRFRSRHAYRMQYNSQQRDPISRQIDNKHAMADRMLAAGPPEWQARHRRSDFPPKPPRMHWRTYERQLERWLALDEWIDDALKARYGCLLTE